MADEPEYSSGKASAEHLCVLVHGLWGAPKHMKNIAVFLREQYPEEKLQILVAKTNAGNFTYDGIDLGGTRVCMEIEEEVKRLAERGQKIRRFSIVGYSLGGLVARYVVGLLKSKGFFKRVSPVNFTTFASPHLGVRAPVRGWHTSMWNALGARTLSRSGAQLFTVDKFQETGKPLIEVLADPSSIFMRGLAHFARRTLYANVVHDRSAPFYTTYISKTDAYQDEEKIEINYVEGYNDVIIPGNAPFTVLDPSINHTTFSERLRRRGRAALYTIPFAALLTIAVPIGVMGFLVNSGIQTFRSSRRIRLHEAGLAGIEVAKYRVPLMLAGMKNTIEDAIEGARPADSLGLSRSSTANEPIDAEKAASRTKTTDSTAKEPMSPTLPCPAEQDLPKLALADYQFRMVDHLDALGFRKFGVYIHNSGHSHAAIVVRSNANRFREGREVLRHWIDCEFEL